MVEIMFAESETDTYDGQDTVVEKEKELTQTYLMHLVSFGTNFGIQDPGLTL